MSINKNTRVSASKVQSPEKLKKEISFIKNNYHIWSILMIALLTAGAFAISNLDYFETAAIAQNVSEGELSAPAVASAKVKTFDYSRPASIGGPLASVKFDPNPATAEAKTIEGRLREIASETNVDSLPLIWAHMGKINNEYGFRRSPFGGGYEFHGGMDIDGDKGDMIVAPGNGVVSKAGWQGGYGNLVEINHGNGLTTRYGHLSRIDVKIGDSIQRGQILGLLGSTGRSTGPHLHYEIRVDDKTINPRKFLPPEMPR